MNKKATNKAAKSNWRHVYGGMAFVIPVALLKHPNFYRMRGPAVKLVLDLGRQFAGNNNGWLCPAWELMRKVGWKSRDTLGMAILEAEHFRIIQKTRQGGKNNPNLYALTFWPIDKKDGDSLDVGPSLSPSNAWLEDRPDFELPEWAVASRAKAREKWRKKLAQREKTLHVKRAA